MASVWFVADNQVTWTSSTRDAVFYASENRLEIRLSEQMIDECGAQSCEIHVAIAHVSQADEVLALAETKLILL